MTFRVEDGPAVTGDRLAILLPEGRIDGLDLLTTLTRAQDHNSSRSNKTGIVWSGDDFGPGDGDTGTDDALSFGWDGNDACVDLPCASDGRRDGASSLLSISPGTATAGGQLAMSWGETTTMASDYSGYLALGCKGCSVGHVNVLRAAATDDGTIVITSELLSGYVAVYEAGSSTYVGKPVAGEVIATVSGVGGASWPKGASVEESALGTLISLTW